MSHLKEDQDSTSTEPHTPPSPFYKKKKTYGGIPKDTRFLKDNEDTTRDHEKQSIKQILYQQINNKTKQPPPPLSGDLRSSTGNITTVVKSTVNFFIQRP